MTQATASLDSLAEAPPRPPADLPQSTVSEIASWLVGHTLDEVERELIRHTLENCGGDRVLAASVLGISLPILRRKMTAYAVRGQALPEPAVPPANNNRATQVPQADNDRVPAPSAAAPEEPEQPKRTGSRLLLGGALTAVLLGLAGAGLFGGKETAKNFVLPERPRIDVSVVERPPPLQHRIIVPVWNGPFPLSAAMPAREAIAAFDSEQDTRMDPAPVDIAEDTRMELGPVDIEQDTRMELGPVDIALDTRMDPTSPAEDTAAAASAAIADGAPEATGSIESAPAFVAPDDVPVPPARAEPVARPRAAAPVRRRTAPPAAPAQAVTAAETLPLPFPFNLFFGKYRQPAVAGSVPADCCVRNQNAP